MIYLNGKNIHTKLGDTVEVDLNSRKQLEYSIELPSSGLWSESIDWCAQYCKSEWGWYFVTERTGETRAVIGFDDPNEMTLWAVKFYTAHQNLGNNQ